MSDIAGLIERLDDAITRVIDRCMYNKGGALMGIPANPDRDIDVLLGMAKDALATLSARNAELEAHNAMLVGALEFYKDGWGWSPGDSGPGGNTPQDPDSWPEEALMEDAGEKARNVLNATPEKIKAAATVLEVAVQWRDGEVSSGAMSKAIGRFLGEDE